MGLCWWYGPKHLLTRAAPQHSATRKISWRPTAHPRSPGALPPPADCHRSTRTSARTLVVARKTQSLALHSIPTGAAHLSAHNRGGLTSLEASQTTSCYRHCSRSNRNFCPCPHPPSLCLHQQQCEQGTNRTLPNLQSVWLALLGEPAQHTTSSILKPAPGLC